MMEFERWLEKAQDHEIKNELLSVVGNEKEIEDRFYKALSFGTGGLRGIIGAGTNRMNIYTVGKATFGLAEYLLATIAVISRRNSRVCLRILCRIKELGRICSLNLRLPPFCPLRCAI